MGSYAASGGYYISCPADAIGGRQDDPHGFDWRVRHVPRYARRPENKLGITVDGVKSNASADFAATSPLTPLQRAMIMRGVDRVYTTFTNHVAEGRNLPIGKVLDIAGGRVWLGKDALEVGLIDTYGGLKTAIALAVDKAELGDGYRVVEVKEEPTGFAAIIASLNVSVREAFARSELGLMMKEYNTVREALNQQGVLMYSPWKVEVR
jgi:SppA_dom: signal peptide peptidase SppA, 36K type